MVKITVDKSFFYAIASVLAVVAILAIGMWVTRDAGQQAAAPDAQPIAPAAQPVAPAAQPVAPAAQPVAPAGNVAPPPAGAAPVDLGAAVAAEGTFESVIAGGEITAEQAAAISRIAPNEALELLNSPDYVWVDVRTAEEYAASHIPGALSLPAYTDDMGLLELPKDKQILLYCA